MVPATATGWLGAPAFGLAAAVALLGGAVAGEAADGAGGGLAAASVSAVAPSRTDEWRPRVINTFDAGMRRKLDRAFRVAALRLRERAACRALFAGLEADGLSRLGATRYRAAESAGDGRVCRRAGGVAAFTAIGNPVTTICPSLDHLNVRQAAVILVHEALHFAGLPESPPTRGAMTSTEINDRIAERCGL